MSRNQVDNIAIATELSTSVRKDGEALIDEFFMAYVCWREACDELRRAVARWSAAPTASRRPTFAAYGASLDREAIAADVYARAAGRLTEDEAAGRE